MTIKRKLVLGATTTFCALALTVPMTFAACPVASDCGCERAQAPILTHYNETCSKCKQNPCCCEKKKNFFSNFYCPFFFQSPSGPAPVRVGQQLCEKQRCF